MSNGRLTIDLDAVVANWRALDRASAGRVNTGAVLKANAYGLGLDRVAPALHRAGVRQFYVAIAREGVALRRILGPDAEIFVFSGLMAGDEADFSLGALIPLLNSPSQIARHRASMGASPYGLQIDSGMNRLGIEPGQIADLGDDVQPRIVMSHLACADTPGHPVNASQLEEFSGIAAMFPDTPGSLAATGGILLGPDYHFDATRPGIGLFGGKPFADAVAVVSLEVPVIQTRSVKSGEIVGYGGAFRPERDTTIAALSCGYADGLIRAMGGQASVFADDIACPVVGRVSMDLLTVDVGHLGEIPDVLTLLGTQQGVDDLAAAAGTIGYEILTSLGDRYERVYKGG